jgi:hypothetical protein
MTSRTGNDVTDSRTLRNASNAVVKRGRIRRTKVPKRIRNDTCRASPGKRPTPARAPDRGQDLDAPAFMKEENMSLQSMALLTAVAMCACGGGNTPPHDGDAAPGADRTAKTAALESGANLLQPKAPVEKIAMYLNGFHVSKDDPTIQMEAHHYCNQVNEDLAQCVLFDGNTAEARMMGLEYIISETLYSTLPTEERAYWHPHNYEILSGQLRLPGLPDAAEEEALKSKMNSYGKTWHTWMTGMHNQKADPLPFGPPHLQWSFNRDGEDIPGMVSARDKRFDFSTADARRRRQDLVALAKAQGGVDAMAPRFPEAKPMTGVIDNGDAATRAVPTFAMKSADDGRAGR